MAEHNGYVEPIGFVWKRGRSCYLAHTWEPDIPGTSNGEEFWDAFTTLAAAKRWVVEATEMPVRWRYESATTVPYRGATSTSSTAPRWACYAPEYVDDGVAPADLPEYP